MLPDDIALPRALTFPTDEPVGWIDVQPWQPQDGEPWLINHDFIEDTTWQRIGAAQGEINIPAGMAVRLRLNRRADLSSLKTLDPDSIQDLIAANIPVEDSDLQYLTHLDGLRTLDIWETRVSSQGLRHLENLQALEHLAWSTSDPNLASLHPYELAPLAKLTGLKSVWLFADSFAEEQLDFLTNLPHLRNLRLFGAELGNSGWFHLSKLSNLRSLSFSGGPVSEQALRYIGQLAHLERLDFSMTESVDGNGFSYLEALEGLTDLSLYWVFNGIENKHFSSLHRWPALAYIGLGGYWVDEVGLGYLAAVPNLRSLNISGNHETKPYYSYQAMQKLEMASGLKRLYLSDTVIELGGLKSLQKLLSLHDLHLANTNLTDDVLEVLESLILLETLNLTGTAITDDGLRHLVNLAQLQKLHLEHTQVNGTGLHALAGLTKLNTLGLGSSDEATLFETESLNHLARNPIQVLTINNGRAPMHSAIEPFSQLRRLSLFGMSFSADDARQVGLLTELRSLDLTKCSLDSETVAYLAGLSNLQSLDLPEAVIPEMAASMLGSLHQLEELNVWHTSITESVLAELQEQLPNCQVFGSSPAIHRVV